VHQVGFSLNEYMEMHGKKHKKYNLVVYGQIDLIYVLLTTQRDNIG
jgi:hypothetical protein